MEKNTQTEIAYKDSVVHSFYLFCISHAYAHKYIERVKYDIICFIHLDPVIDVSHLPVYQHMIFRSLCLSGHACESIHVQVA